jgi:hypothetical protein
MPKNPYSSPFGPKPKAKPPAGPNNKPVFNRGPLNLQGSLIKSQEVPDIPGDVPPWFQRQYPAATKPEWAIYWAWTIKLKKTPNLDFVYQANLIGGRIDLGGIVVDFESLDPPGIAINIQGIYWHYDRGAQQLARDQLQRGQISALGFQVIYIDEDHALADPVYYLKEALRGVDHSREARAV